MIFNATLAKYIYMIQIFCHYLFICDKVTLNQIIHINKVGINIYRKQPY